MSRLRILLVVKIHLGGRILSGVLVASNRAVAEEVDLVDNRQVASVIFSNNLRKCSVVAVEKRVVAAKMVRCKDQKEPTSRSTLT